ncbi:MAG: hypothetical protein HRT71_18290 [Flavobacteriales bacterium]|nr:hypothetical protein [Flavobacteriales bacterium]
MNVRGLKIGVVAIAIICMSVAQSFAGKNSADFESAKFDLIENLFSCQSIVQTTSTLDEGLQRLKFIYLGLGTECSEKASDALDRMQAADSEFSKKLVKSISTLIKSYNDFYTKANDLTKAEMSDGSVLERDALEKIVTELFKPSK